MKRILLLLLFISEAVFGQEGMVTENASFPGGIIEYVSFMEENLEYPRQALRMGIEGRVIVEFIILSDGRAIDIRIVKGIGAGCDQEVIRVMNEMPRWSPAKIVDEETMQKLQTSITFSFNVDGPAKIFPSTEFHYELVFEDTPPELKDQIFTIVEQPAQFPGGMKEFYKFLSQNLIYPEKAIKEGVEGRVFAQFIIEKDGTPTDIHLVKGIGGGCDEEALRVLKTMPKWIPAEQRGIKVRHKMIQNILFKLPTVFNSVEAALDFKDFVTGLILSNQRLDSVDKRISQLKNIEILNVENNKLSDISIITTLPIKELYLSQNQFSSLPKSFEKMNELRLFSASRNNFQTVPESLLSLSKLEVIDLGSNNLKSLPDNISALKNLEVLSIQSNPDLNTLPEGIQKLKKLRMLFVGGTSIPNGELKKLARKNKQLEIFTEIQD